MSGCSGLEDIPFCGRSPDDCGFIITGKWFNYSIVFLVMILDFNNYKNQVLYHPNYYAQYTDRNYYVWSMTDEHESMRVKPLFDKFAVNNTLWDPKSPWTPENTAAWDYCRGCCSTAPHNATSLVDDPKLGLALPAAKRCDHHTMSKYKTYTNWEMKSSFFFIFMAAFNFFGQMIYIGGYNLYFCKDVGKLDRMRECLKELPNQAQLDQNKLSRKAANPDAPFSGGFRSDDDGDLELIDDSIELGSSDMSTDMIVNA